MIQAEDPADVSFWATYDVVLVLSLSNLLLPPVIKKLILLDKFTHPKRRLQASEVPFPTLLFLHSHIAALSWLLRSLPSLCLRHATCESLYGPRVVERADSDRLGVRSLLVGGVSLFTAPPSVMNNM